MSGQYQVPSAIQPVVDKAGRITTPWWQWVQSIGLNAGTPIDWSVIVNTPTTLGGYGITDAYTESQVDALIAGLSGTYQPLSAVLTAYASGDTPSAFTLGIVDSADAATWRTALGAGTSSFSGNAADLIGTLADARLSSNVPLKNAANTFTESLAVTRSGTAGFTATDSSTSVAAFFRAGSSVGYLGTSTNHAFELYTNNALRGTIAAAGNWTINAASSGDELTVVGSVVATSFAGALTGDVTGTASAAPWSGITGKPTTLAGYGITDGATDSELSSAISALSSVYQPLDAILTELASLADAAGVLTNDGAGNLSWVSGPTYGTYTPTGFTGTNVSAVTPASCQYTRVGDMVTVSGSVAVTITSSGSTNFGISLPIASSLANNNELAGAGAQVSGNLPFAIRADTTNDRAQFTGFTAGGSSSTISFIFSYRVI